MSKAGLANAPLSLEIGGWTRLRGEHSPVKRLAHLPPACGGSHLLGRALREQGHEVRLIPAQYVKPYVKTNKSDYIDAEAIAEAVGRPTMRFVPVKSDDQLGSDVPFDTSEATEHKKVQHGGSFLCTDQYCSRYIVGTLAKGEVSTGT